MTYAPGRVGAVGHARDSATDPASGGAPDADPLSFLDAARERAETEREELAAERDAFEQFADRVADIDAEPPAEHAGTPAAMTLLRPESGDATGRIVAAYRETVMALPHYDDTYGDSTADSLRAELGPHVGEALTDGTGLSPPLRSAVAEAARAAARRRVEFDRTLRGELQSLEAAREALSEVDSVLGTLATRDRSGRTEGRTATLDRQVERCEAVASERQALRRQRLLPDHLDADDLCTYLYNRFDWTYPVLSAVTALRERIERLRDAGDGRDEGRGRL